MNDINTTELKEKIFLEKPIYNSDNMGGVTVEWQFFDKLWASVKNWQNLLYKVRNLEEFILSTENLIFFKIRYRKNLTNQLRIKYKNAYFQILKLINFNESNKIIYISARELKDEI